MPQRKIIVAVAPVAHMHKVLPPGLKNPVRSEEVAAETIACWKAGASLVHLHVRDEEGTQVADLETFSRTIDLIRQESDIIIQGSTGGFSTLSLDERSVSVHEPRVQMGALNMGSTNFEDGVYINTWDDIRYWSDKMKKLDVVPELEIFDLSMIESSVVLANEGVLDYPLNFNLSLGFHGALSATADNIHRLKNAMPARSGWSFLEEGMQDFAMLAVAMGCGASGIRVGFEAGFYSVPGKPCSNVQLVEHAVALVKQMGCEVATAQEAHAMLHMRK